MDFRLQQAHHRLNIPEKFELVVAPKARLTSLFWQYLPDPFALAQLELDWHSQLFEAAHKILTFGRSKLLDCPSCLVQPQPQCLWVCKKQFFCWFSSLAWSFAGAFRHLLEFFPPQAPCLLGHARSRQLSQLRAILQMEQSRHRKAKRQHCPTIERGKDWYNTVCVHWQHPSAWYLESGNCAGQL